MQPRLPEEISTCMGKLLRDYPVMDGFSIGGSIAAGLGVVDIDVDLLFSSEQALSSLPYHSIYAAWSGLCKILTQEFQEKGMRLQIVDPVFNGNPKKYPDTTIYVMKDVETMEKWKLDSLVSEIYLATQ